LEGLVGRRLRWRDVEIVPNLRVRHLTFFREEGVRKPVFKEVYTGVVSEDESLSITIVLESFFPYAKTEKRIEFGALGVYPFSLRYSLCGEY